ncbi:MAG: glycosyltransferase family 2 protein [Candidatus Omnitrophica bacterium]|nr:glycosyltransferase family 2 protein [Candidatus Omnitrophota bacterium]
MNAEKDKKSISIVIPTYKSAENLTVLVERLKAVLDKCAYSYEIIFIEDASPDNSLEILKDIALKDPRVKIISFSRNFGQQIAICCGLQHSEADAVIIMDDDLQDPPEFIPELIKKWEEGYEVVYAVRKARKEGYLKKIGYRLYYWILANLSSIKIPKDSGDFGLIDRKIVDIINNMPEQDRFVRGLRAWTGFKQIGIEYERAYRYKGEPAYKLFKILKLSTDGIFAFSNMPLRISSALGFIVAGIAFLGIVFTLIQKIITLIFPDNVIAVWPGFSTIVLSILFIGGVQLICIGILGEYIARIYNEVKKRPLFLIKEKVGFKEEKK